MQLELFKNWSTKYLNSILLIVILLIIALFAAIQFNYLTLYKHDYASLVFPKRDFYVDPRKAIIVENYDKFYCDKEIVKSNELLVCNVYMKQKMDSNIDNLIEFHINNVLRDVNNPEVDGYFGCVRGNTEYTLFRCTSAPFNLEKGIYKLDLKVVDTIYQDVKRVTVQ
jgi:hypothetical protein